MCRIPLRLAIALVLPALSATAAAARDCRPPPDAPPGVRVPPPPGCLASPPPQAPRGDALRAGRQDGFVDLGGGSSVRIGGRVRVDAAGRR
jgi:hypothetical protein